MGDMARYLICLFMLCVTCFGAGIEFAVWLHKRAAEERAAEERARNCEI